MSFLLSIFVEVKQNINLCVYTPILNGSSLPLMRTYCGIMPKSHQLNYQYDLKAPNGLWHFALKPQ